MNRDEYRQAIRDYFPGDNSWKYYSNNMDFPRVLRDVAVELFEKGDLTSPLAVETKRRLHQLRTTGTTDK